MPSENKYGFIFNSLNAGVWEYEYETNKLFFSEKCDEIFNDEMDCSQSECSGIIGHKIHDDDYLDVLENVYKVFSNTNRSFEYEFRMCNGDKITKYINCSISSNYDEEKQSYIYIGGSFKDVTQVYKKEKEIERYAFYDALTGLYNRSYMKENIDRILEENSSLNSALIYFDLDDFKYINDIFGYAFGDKIIKEASERISDVSKNYLVSRFSGDELCIFIADTTKMPHSLHVFVRNILETMNISYYNDDVNYKVSVSIGVATSPKDGMNFSDLLKCAEIALYEAKAAGKNCYAFYDNSMILKLQDRVQMEKELKAALKSKDELVLYLQPQYEVKSGKLKGFEALTRWISPTRGFIPPTNFIPVAEETRLIVPLGRWVIKESCRIIAKFSELGHHDLKISANLSPIQLLDDELVDVVKNSILEYKINPSNLVLEITESVLMENFDANICKLNILKQYGIKISLDDFGTGYSSLTYLKLLPISTLKIDKSFIDHITTEEVDMQITLQIINLAHVLNLETVAEGVETKAQLKLLNACNCDVIQGYLGGRPMPIGDIYRTLDKRLLEL